MTATRAGGTPAGAPRGLIPSLVGVRGVLAAVVVAVHLAPYASALAPVSAPVWDAVWRHGYISVDVFFVLSGYVLTSRYRVVFARWPGWPNVGRYLWARLSRFFPVHLAVLVALVAAVAFGKAVGVAVPHGGDLGVDLARNLSLTQGWGGAHALTWNGPAWSLSAVWFCYLIFPVVLPLVVRVRSGRGAIIAYLFVVAAPLVAYSFLGFDDAEITYRAPLFRAVGDFVGGAMLCRLTHVGSRLAPWAGRCTGMITGLSLAALALLAVLGASALFVVPLAGLIILALGEQRGRLNALLSSKPLLRSGEVSVSLFFTHVPWLLAAALVITPARFPGVWGWVAILLLVAGAVATAYATRAVIEVPAQRLMGRLVDRPRQAPTLPVDRRTAVAAGPPSTDRPSRAAP